MYKSFSEKAALTVKILPVMTLGFLININSAIGIENPTPLEGPPLQPKYNLTMLFQHIAENQPDAEGHEVEHRHNVHTLRHQHPQPLTELLHKSDKDAWHDVVSYIAKRDFILSGILTFRHLSGNDLLNRLALEKSSWKRHVEGIGALLEKQGVSLVTDKRFGLPLQNLITSNYQITTFSSFKSLAQLMQETKASDAQLKEMNAECQKIVKSYLEEHDLLRKI